VQAPKNLIPGGVAGLIGVAPFKAEVSQPGAKPSNERVMNLAVGGLLTQPDTHVFSLEARFF